MSALTCEFCRGVILNARSKATRFHAHCRDALIALEGAPLVVSGLTAEIKATNGVTCVVDRDLLRWLALFRWFMGANGYMQATVARRFVAMHRLVMRASPGQVVDHADGNVLNNTMANLRITDVMGNSANRVKRASGTLSRFKGVTFHRGCGKWQASVRIPRGGMRYLGLYENEVDAARAYDAAARATWGEMARVNFPCEVA